MGVSDDESAQVMLTHDHQALVFNRCKLVSMFEMRTEGDLEG